MTDLSDSPAPNEEHLQRSWRSRRGQRRVWTAAWLVSLGMHLAVMVWYGFFSRGIYVPQVGVSTVMSPAGPLEGMRVLRIQEEEDSGPEDESREERPTAPVLRPPEEEARVVSQEPEEAAGQAELPREEARVVERPTHADRIRVPAQGDPRLWSFVDPERGELTDAERYQIALWYRLSVWYDSLGAAAEAERRALDWTYTDENGKKWGVSPGRIHLGDLTLPLPFSFGVPATQREQVGEVVRQWEDINRGAQMDAVWESWRDRARAIRERMDRERGDTLPPRNPGN